MYNNIFLSIWWYVKIKRVLFDNCRNWIKMLRMHIWIQSGQIPKHLRETFMDLKTLNGALGDKPTVYATSLNNCCDSHCNLFHQYMKSWVIGGQGWGTGLGVEFFTDNSYSVKKYQYVLFLFQKPKRLDKI